MTGRYQRDSWPFDPGLELTSESDVPLVRGTDPQIRPRPGPNERTSPWSGTEGGPTDTLTCRLVETESQGRPLRLTGPNPTEVTEEEIPRYFELAPRPW